MFEIIYKGILVGLFVSVPMGPIGMLCVQRTLNRGQLHGLITGLGATTSDLLYTIISLFFLSFVDPFIEKYRLIIQLSVSVILIVFGYFIYNSHPSAQPKPSEGKSNSLFNDFITSFGLTLSNPLVLLVLIALFAKFDFLSNESTLSTITIGISSILFGATMWWTTLTFLISRFKNKMSLKGLRVINMLTGVVIITIGIIGTLFTIFP